MKRVQDRGSNESELGQDNNQIKMKRGISIVRLTIFSIESGLVLLKDIMYLFSKEITYLDNKGTHSMLLLVSRARGVENDM